MLALDYSAKDIPNLNKLAGRLSGRIPARASEGGLEITMRDMDNILLNGMESVVGLGYSHDSDLTNIESNGYLETVPDAVNTRAKKGA